MDVTTRRVWHLSDSHLEIREGESVDAEERLLDLFESEWARLGFQVFRTRESEPGTWQMSIDRWVGIARLPDRDGHSPQIQIRPKVDADFLFLADYAFGRERNRIAELHLQAHVEMLRDLPAAQLIAWFLAELETFILRHLRRDYIVQREVFEARIRGRLLMSDYLQRYVAAGRPHLAPCQFFEFTQDNLANQILRRSLRELRRLATLLPLPKARQELSGWADRLLPFLGAVGDREIYDVDFNRLRLRGSMRQYAPIMEKCRALLGHVYVSTEFGGHVQDAFLWNMPALFEQGLRGILQTTPGVKLRPRAGTAVVERSDGERLQRSAVVPDYLLQIANRHLILDAKYKDTGVVPESEDDVIEVEIASSQAIRVHRSDVYQVIAYGQHESYGPAAVALVYPLVLLPGQYLPRPYRITGFVEDVLIIFVDVGPHAAENLERFREVLFETVGRPQDVAALAA